MTKEDLKQCAALCKEADTLSELICKLEHRRGSSEWSELAELAYDSRVRLYKRLLDHIEGRLAAVSLALDRLPSNERELLVLRYFEDWNWVKISQRLGYSEKHVVGYLHKKALEGLEKIKV